MADNHRHEEIFELTEDMASAPKTASTIPRASSIPPEPISPFQPLVDPNAPKIEEEPVEPIRPREEQRPSFVPKPVPEAVKMSPIARVTGKTTSEVPPGYERAKLASQQPAAPTEAPPTKVETAPAKAEEPESPTNSTPPTPPNGPGGVSNPPPPSIPATNMSHPPPPPTKAESAKQAPAGVNGGVSPDQQEATTVAAPKAYPEEEVEDLSEEIDLMQTETTPAPGLFESDESILELSHGDDNGNARSLDELDGKIADAVEEAIGSELATEAKPDVAEPVFESLPSRLDPSVPAPPDQTGSDDDDAEELDLSEVEEMPQASPPPITGGEGRKPRLRRRQKPNKEWWAKIFNDDYVSTIPKATVRGDLRKVNFIEKNLGLAPNALVLDLACGNGRHSVGMAKRGYRLVGIDLSLPMLAQAAELAQEEHQNINFIHGDMRDLSFDKTFDAIFCMGTSFGYFSDEVNEKVMQGVFRALKPGGTFLIEVANRDHVITQTPDLTWFEGNGSVCMEESQFDFHTSRLHVTRQLIMDGGRQVQNEISIRLYTLHEMTSLFDRSGFVIGNISGHTATPGAFFGPDSVRIFITAQRPI